MSLPEYAIAIATAIMVVANVVTIVATIAMIYVGEKRKRKP